ncbi:hypothetical protein, partial [Nocardia sp. NPDC004711]
LRPSVLINRHPADYARRTPLGDQYPDDTNIGITGCAAAHQVLAAGSRWTVLASRCITQTNPEVRSWRYVT